MEQAGIGGGDYFEFLQTLRERWSAAELQEDEMRPAIAAIAQLHYRDELGGTIQAAKGGFAYHAQP
jgi:hypothetical protein